MKQTQSNPKTPLATVITAAIMSVCAIFIIENARILAYEERSTNLYLYRSLGCLLLALAGYFLKFSGKGCKAVTLLLALACQSPLVLYFYEGLRYGQFPPFEKTILFVIECQVAVLCLFFMNAALRRTCIILAGIVGLIAYSSIHELTSMPSMAMFLITLLTPVWMILEHALANPVIHFQSHETEALKSASGRRFMPLLRMACYLVLGTIAFTVVKSDRAIQTVLGEWVSSSGGTGETNELATSGVGDGPNEVSASKDPQTTGFSDSEIYLETDRSSLFDAFNEQFGEPYKKQNFERMQAMGAQDVRENGDRPKENLQAGRTFELNRQPNQQKKRNLHDRQADALVYVQGEPETRLKLSSFDRFDGESWFTEHDCSDNCSLTIEQKQPDKCWFCLHRPVSDLNSKTITHKIKIANLETSVLPSPNNLWKFLVGGIRQSEMFGWAGVQMIRVRDRNFPAGTTLETVSNKLSRRALHELHFHSGKGPTRHHEHFSGRFSQIDTTSVKSLLDSWKVGSEKSWMQVEKLISRLQNHATLDDNHQRSLVNTASPEGAVDDFLFGTRRGPDYLFATAAVVLLRELGYPCRLASGFYIDPASYSEEKSHYALKAENLHFWVEILLPTNNWAVVDPTPGYGDELHSDSLYDTAWIWFYYARAWFFRNLVEVTLATLAVLTLFLLRRQVYDRAVCLWLNRIMPFQPRRQVVLTLRHIEWRLACSGMARPKGCTLRRHWLGTLALSGKAGTLISLGEWAAYAAMDIEPGRPGNEIRSICQKSLEELNLNHFSKLRSEKTSP